MEEAFTGASHQEATEMLWSPVAMYSPWCHMKDCQTGNVWNFVTFFSSWQIEGVS